MPLPIIKIFIVVVRTFARPFNAVLVRRLKNNVNGKEEQFFYRVGMKSFEFENFLEQQINKKTDV